MTSRTAKLATWLGPEEASLFGILEFPEDRLVRAGVVVVPSLGIEQVTTYRGARRLTERLAQAGFVTLRYDHPGTGSSVGDQLSDTSWQEWSDAVTTGVGYVRAMGVEHVSIIGIRAGCLIADAAFASGGAFEAGLIHWDPPLSGRRWLREQTSKYRIAVGDVDRDPGVSVLGGQFSFTAARHIKQATWTVDAPVDLVAARPSVLADPAAEDILADRTVIAELSQADLFAAPPAFIHHVPEPDIEILYQHLVGHAGRNEVTIDPVARLRAVVGRRRDGSVVVEELRTITDNELLLFTTYVEGDVARGGVVFQSTALEPPWGPSRAWVEAARDNAGSGLACFRFDKTGSGEAGRVGRGEMAVLYSNESRRDALGVLAEIGIPPRKTLLVGLCSGAWISAESAIRTRAAAVLLFGMIQWSRVREPVTREFLESLGYDSDSLVPPSTDSARARLKPLARRYLPYRLWDALGRRGTTQVPGPLLEDLRQSGVRTTVALTPEDDEHFVRQRGDESLRRLRRRGFTGRIELIKSPSGDHNLYRPDTRASARRLVAEEADELRTSLGLPVVGVERRPLRALFVNENIGGHATVHSALRRALADRSDVEAEFLDARGPGAIGRIIRAPIPGLDRVDLDLQPLRGQLVHSQAINRRFRDRVQRGDIDAVHVYTQNGMLGGARLLKQVPTVISTDSTGLRNAYSIPYRAPTRFTRTSSRVGLLFERPVLTAAHHVFANSVPVLESLTSPDYGLDLESVSLLKMGIWSPFLVEEAPVRPTDRRPTIVFVGTSMERKGGTLLLEAWRSSLRDRADLLLITLDPVVEEPGLRVVGDLAPGDDRLWGLLSAADIMCFPSVIDQAPNAILEASAAGLPVIAHPGGAIPEMVVHGTTGLLVDGADPRAVVAALDTLISDPDLRRRMGSAGARHIREQYGITGSAERIISALRHAVDTAADEEPIMSFRIHDTIDERLRLEWHDLSDEVGTRFSSRPSYGLSWHRHLGRGPLRVAVVRRRGRLVALLPLHQRRRLGIRVYRLLGHGLGTIGEALATDTDALTELVSGLAQAGAVLELTHLPATSPLLSAVQADRRWDCNFSVEDHCPVIALPPGIRAHDLRSRSTLSRAASTRRKLAREGRELVVETIGSVAEFDARWPDIVATAAAAGIQESEDRLNLCAPPFASFTREFLRLEAESGNLLIWGATFGGLWGAHFATLVTKGTAELWFTRFDPAHRSSRPGHHLIEAACDQHDDVGVSEVDLLIGRSGYKADWQTGEYEVGTLVALPSGVRAPLARMGATERAARVLRDGSTRAATAARRVRAAMSRLLDREPAPAVVQRP